MSCGTIFRRIGGFLLPGVAVAGLLGCGAGGVGLDSRLHGAVTRVALQDEGAAATIDPIHITAIGEASEAAEKIGFRIMQGIMTHSHGTTAQFDPVDGGAFDQTADNPVTMVDINYTDELDENFSVEISAGTVVFGDGFRAPMANAPTALPDSRHELKGDNNFYVLGGMALFRIGSGRFGRVYGGPGVNLYINNVPGKEEEIKFTGMLTWKAFSGPRFSFSVDAKYWLLGFGKQEYAFLGANLAWRY